MEIIKKGVFITDFYGSVSAEGAESVLKKWIDDKQSAALLSWAEKVAKKGQTAFDTLTEILSILHRDDDGNPVIGNWMFRKCLITTGETIFNALKDKSHPKRALIPMGITLVEPLLINLTRKGKIIANPEGVKTYTVTTKKASFFKAYEFVKAGAEFEVKIYVDDELLKEEHVATLLEKCGSIGVGSFRERFGKFKFIV